MSIPSYLQDRSERRRPGLEGAVAAANLAIPAESTFPAQKQPGPRPECQMLEHSMTPDFERLNRMQEVDKSPIIKLKSTLEPVGRRSLRQMMNGRDAFQRTAAHGFCSEPRGLPAGRK